MAECNLFSESKRIFKVVMECVAWRPPWRYAVINYVWVTATLSSGGIFFFPTFYEGKRFLSQVNYESSVFQHFHFHSNTYFL